MEKVYLSGHMTDLSLEVQVSWREEATEYLENVWDMQVLNPCRSTTMPKDETGCYLRDMWDVKRADLIFINLQPEAKNISVGTMIEIGWATMLQKPLIIVTGPDTHELYLRHPFIRDCTSFHVKDFEDGLDLIPEILGRTK